MVKIPFGAFFLRQMGQVTIIPVLLDNSRSFDFKISYQGFGNRCFSGSCATGDSNHNVTLHYFTSRSESPNAFGSSSEIVNVSLSFPLSLTQYTGIFPQISCKTCRQAPQGVTPPGLQTAMARNSFSPAATAAAMACLSAQTDKP